MPFVSQRGQYKLSYQLASNNVGGGATIVDGTYSTGNDLYKVDLPYNKGQDMSIFLVGLDLSFTQTVGNSTTLTFSLCYNLAGNAILAEVECPIAWDGGGTGKATGKIEYPWLQPANTLTLPGDEYDIYVSMKTDAGTTVTMVGAVGLSWTEADIATILASS
jgi:hypothetical protein